MSSIFVYAISATVSFSVFSILTSFTQKLSSFLVSAISSSSSCRFAIKLTLLLEVKLPYPDITYWPATPRADCFYRPIKWMIRILRGMYDVVISITYQLPWIRYRGYICCLPQVSCLLTYNYLVNAQTSLIECTSDKTWFMLYQEEFL